MSACKIRELTTGVQHIGIPTQDIGATIEFYEKLGFENVFETINEQNGARVIFFRLHDLLVETYEEKETKMESGALDHLAINVTDVEKVYEVVCEMGMNNQNDEIHSIPFWDNGMKYFKIEGPNHEVVEFSQFL